MATVQYERDLRSTQKAVKRRKDSAVKWSYGVRALPGTQDVSVNGKVRPVLKGSPWTPLFSHAILDEATAREREATLDWTTQGAYGIPDDEDSIAPAVYYQPTASHPKRNRKTVASKLPSSRVPPETDLDAACSEMDLLGSPRRSSGQGTVLSIPAAASETAVATARGILLCEPDASDASGPVPALSLGIFAKPNVRATEKLVKKEYEILDTNGEAIKGRKARQVLRQETDTAAPSGLTPSDDEEFELV